MNTLDPFDSLARHYDQIMEHVDYDRWHAVSHALAKMAPSTMRHLDLACGTGVLLERLRDDGWNSAGLDLSRAMLHQARRRSCASPLSLSQGDAAALPFANQSFDFITCLFDSLNFLLENDLAQQAIVETARVLRPGGILYFDAVTERMVTDHFDGQEWTEVNGGIETTWSSEYDRGKNIANSRVRVGPHDESLIRERIYPLRFWEDAIQDAGLQLLGVYDAHNWKKPRKRTTRLDFIAVKDARATDKRAFEKILDALRNQ
jgi:ubiquinone/menaquinone biosynthesis C-methylase UbiE